MGDIFARITESIVSAIDAGSATTELPWHRSQIQIPWNAATERPYRGINVLSLWLTAAAEGYPDGPWASYRQWLSLGAQVRKGAKGTPIIFYREFEPSDAADDDERKHLHRVARAYHVFNAAQVIGWQPQVSARPELPESECQVRADAFFSGVGAAVVHAGENAFYRPSTDTIHMPPFAAFKSALGYYAVLAHEHIHWTGAPHRLARQVGAPRYSEVYAAEELIAELGAAFLCASLSLSLEPRPDHAAYVASWLKLLRNDKRAIFRAASLATQAVEFLSVKANDTLSAWSNRAAAA